LGGKNYFFGIFKVIFKKFGGTNDVGPPLGGYLGKMYIPKKEKLKLKKKKKNQNEWLATHQIARVACATPKCSGGGGPTLAPYMASG
jgi:hypothetical protein